MQASLYQLTLDRRVGEHVLPEGWRSLKAGNRAEDKLITFRMPAALANRFIHLDFEIDFEDWRNWALAKGVAPLVIAFLSTCPELLHSMDDPECGFPTPRSWEMVSDILGAHDGEQLVDDLVTGIVGEAAAIEFLAYCSDAIREEEILRIIRSPPGPNCPRSFQTCMPLYPTSQSMLAMRRYDAASVLIGRLFSGTRSTGLEIF